MAKVSVLLPVYNTNPDHLRAAIDSILCQSFTDFELLIYNDASTEPHVEEVVQSYNDERIQYFASKENAGISEVRNKLLDLANGEYLAVMDHDDLFLQGKLEKQVTLMDNNPNIGVRGTSYKRFGYWLKRKTVRFPQNNDDIRAELFFRNVIHHPSCMIRKDILVKHNIRYDGTYISANDKKLFMDITEVSEGFNIQDVFCKYRLHKNMTSKAKRDGIVREHRRIRKDSLNRMQAELTSDEEDILNDFVLKGRARIRDYETLVKIEAVLSKLSQTNTKSQYFDETAFDRLCARYLIKRCVNGAFYGGISSKTLLQETKLPVEEQKKPVLLRIVNTLK